MSELQELQLDLDELLALVPQVRRTGNLNLLENRIRVLEVEIKQKSKVQQQEKEKGKEDQVIYTGITKYSWEQEGKKVKIQIGLDGIGQLSKDNFIIDFKEESVDLRINQYKNQYLRFGVKQLNGKIKVPECSFKTTNNSVYITLIKQDNKQWDQLAYKESIVKEDKNIDKGDPNASLMNMMKDMYQNGDEDMKRTIAQAWSKSQTEKQGI